MQVVIWTQFWLSQSIDALFIRETLDVKLFQDGLSIAPSGYDTGPGFKSLSVTWQTDRAYVHLILHGVGQGDDGNVVGESDIVIPVKVDRWTSENEMQVSHIKHLPWMDVDITNLMVLMVVDFSLKRVTIVIKWTVAIKWREGEREREEMPLTSDSASNSPNRISICDGFCL